MRAIRWLAACVYKLYTGNHEPQRTRLPIVVRFLKINQYLPSSRVLYSLVILIPFPLLVEAFTATSYKLYFSIKHTRVFVHNG